MINKVWKKTKARRLVREGKIKIDFETDMRIHLTVKSKEEHFVIYDKVKNEFSCDCKWFALKKQECSHILACKIYLKNLGKIKEDCIENVPHSKK
jgi:hypothetical protein